LKHLEIWFYIREDVFSWQDSADCIFTTESSKHVYTVTNIPTGRDKSLRRVTNTTRRPRSLQKQFRRAAKRRIDLTLIANHIFNVRLKIRSATCKRARKTIAAISWKNVCISSYGCRAICRLRHDRYSSIRLSRAIAPHTNKSWVRHRNNNDYNNLSVYYDLIPPEVCLYTLIF